MSRRVIVLISMFLLAMLTVGFTVASDDAPKPGTPEDNACNPGGVLYREENQDGCPTDWYWKAGWYLARFLSGKISRENFPKEFESVLPPLPEEVPVDALAGAPAGCYKSSIGDFDFRFNGHINQKTNLVVNTSKDGSCSGFNFNGMLVYFVGNSANALLFCKSIDPTVVYVENSLSRGYPVPNQYYWGCA